MNVCLTGIAWFLFGFSVAFGNYNSDNENNSSGTTFIGSNNIGLTNFENESKEWSFYYFQFAFVACVVSIISGTMVERTTIIAYGSYSVFVALWVYPVLCHWFWDSNGWLSTFNDDNNKTNSDIFGVIDFGGGGVVHMVGGFSGLVGCIILGPRLGRFRKHKRKRHKNKNKHRNGKRHDENMDNNDDPDRSESPRSISSSGETSVSSSGSFSPNPYNTFSERTDVENVGNSTAFQVFGTFCLWVGWYGFNCGSTLGASNMMQVASKVALNTTCVI